MSEPDFFSLGVGFDCSASNDDDIAVNDRSFTAVSLHDRSQHSWAVIGDLSGAIAANGDGSLLMRMREDDARKTAANLTATARRGPTRH